MQPDPRPRPRNNNPPHLAYRPAALVLVALLLAAPLACGDRSVQPAVDSGGADAATTDSATNDSAANDSAPTGDFNPGPISCTSNQACSPTSYCYLTPDCGKSGPGTCMPRPIGCTADCPGVCGCDGKTYCNSCGAAAAGVSTASKGPCNSCSKAKCVVVNDCCGCKAIDANVTKAKPCPAMCYQPQCAAAGIKQATAYCKQGKCFLGDAKTGCSTDADCSLVNDCCSCAALPTSVQTPYCSLPNCYVPTCTALGFPKAKAVCGAQGLCTLSL